MASLKSRIEELEKSAPVGDGDHSVLVVGFVTASPDGPVECPSLRISTIGGDWAIDRKEGESTAAFRERAQAAAPKNARGMAYLLEVPA